MIIEGKQLKRLDIFKKLIKYYGDILEFIPKEEIDQDLCIMALKSYGDSLQFMPNIFKT